MYNLVNLSGKRIIVTGASSGIGRETAILLSRLGANVILVARRRDELEKTLSMLERSAEHSIYEYDLDDVEGISEFIKKIVNNHGTLDGLAYCAGIGLDYPLKFMKPDLVEKVMRVNYMAFVEMIRSLSMRKHYNRGMRIVGVSSTASIFGSKAHSAYSASKAAMDSTVRCLALELSNKGICINTVAPSMIATPMYEEFLARNDEESDIHKSLVSRQYLGIGEMVDVANGIAFLLSDASKFITGICLPIDGGFSTN